MSPASEKSPAATQPHLQVLRGSPTDEELAALISVLGSAGGGAVEAESPERNLWGAPVDKLRYSLLSHARMSLQNRTHVRR